MFPSLEGGIGASGVPRLAMASKQRVNLKKSLDWIRAHPFATNHDVSPELREEWMHDFENESQETCGFQLAAFTFGYCQRQLMNSPAGMKLSISSSKLVELFQRWQLKLALAEVNEKTDLKSTPLPLFEFRDEEEIQCWRHSHS